MRRPLVIVFTVLCVTLVMSPATATEPMLASGEWTYVPTIVRVEEVGPHLYLYGEDVGTWTGTLTGTSIEDFVVVVHADGNNYYRGIMEFTGTVKGRSGTLVIEAAGVQIPGGLEPGTGGDWSGQWMVRSGTGDLEHMRGRGIFWGPSLDLDYLGRLFTTG